jgi:hypothetical protein
MEELEVTHIPAEDFSFETPLSQDEEAPKIKIPNPPSIVFILADDVGCK